MLSSVHLMAGGGGDLAGLALAGYDTVAAVNHLQAVLLTAPSPALILWAPAGRQRRWKLDGRLLEGRAELSRGGQVQANEGDLLPCLVVDGDGEPVECLCEKLGRCSEDVFEKYDH